MNDDSIKTRLERIETKFEGLTTSVAVITSEIKNIKEDLNEIKEDNKKINDHLNKFNETFAKVDYRLQSGSETFAMHQDRISKLEHEFNPDICKEHSKEIERLKEEKWINKGKLIVLAVIGSAIVYGAISFLVEVLTK